jgi:hypothetical protein
MAKGKPTLEEKTVGKRAYKRKWHEENRARVREQQRANHKKWRREHPEKVREMKRRYRATHLEEERARDRDRGRRRTERTTPEQKASSRRKSSRWREKHPERVREVRRKSREKAPEKARARYRAWAAVNREKRRANAKKWYEAHPDRVLAANRENYARNRNRKEFKEHQRRYKAEHWAIPGERLILLLSSARHRAKARGFGFEESLCAILKAAPPTECACCHATLDYSTGKGRGQRSPSLDRVDNAKGYTVGNVAVICDRCNNIKGTATVERLLTRCNGMKRGSLRRHPVVASIVEEIENIIAYMRAHHPENGGRGRALNREMVTMVQHEQRRRSRSGSPGG